MRCYLFTTVSLIGLCAYSSAVSQSLSLSHRDPSAQETSVAEADIDLTRAAYDRIKKRIEQIKTGSAPVNGDLLSLVALAERIKNKIDAFPVARYGEINGSMCNSQMGYVLEWDDNTHTPGMRTAWGNTTLTYNGSSDYPIYDEYSKEVTAYVETKDHNGYHTDYQFDYVDFGIPGEMSVYARAQCDINTCEYAYIYLLSEAFFPPNFSGCDKVKVHTYHY